MPSEIHFTSLDALLRFAIGHRRLVEFVYDGRRRVAEPHDYGVLGGRERLLVYQLTARPASDRTSEGWRLLDVAKMQSWRLLEDRFPGSRHQAHERHLQWDAVYVRVST